MNIIFAATYCIWLITELLLNKLLRSKNTDRKNADKHSLTIIWLTVMATIFVAVLISMMIKFPIFQRAPLQYLGLAIISIGIVLRLVAVVSLGPFFTVDVTIRQDHVLKKNGPYKYLRHPSYFASLISFIGFGFSLNNWISLLITTIAVTTVFIIRIRIEEKLLIEQFGSEYLDYKKSTSGFIPFIY